MKNAKIIIGMDKDAFENLKEANNYVNLNLAFQRDEGKDLISFFIPSIVEGYKNFSDNHKNTFILNLNFTKKPSEDLIEIISEIIEDKEKFDKRQNTRINVNNKIAQDIGLTSPKIVIEIDKIKRTGILRNISTSGCSLLLSCIAKFLMDKPVLLFIASLTFKSVIKINGSVKWSNKIEGRKDIYEIGVEFDKERIPSGV